MPTSWSERFTVAVTRLESLLLKCKLYSHLDGVFLIQQLVAVSIWPILTIVWDGASHAIGLPAGALGRASAGLGAMVVFCGYTFPRSRRSSEAACYTWILPGAAFVLAFLDEIRHLGPKAAIAAFFSGAVQDDESLATLFFTLPTVSALAYSIGALLKRRSEATD